MRRNGWRHASFSWLSPGVWVPHRGIYGYSPTVDRHSVIQRAKAGLSFASFRALPAASFIIYQYRSLGWNCLYATELWGYLSSTYSTLHKSWCGQKILCWIPMLAKYVQSSFSASLKSLLYVLQITLDSRLTNSIINSTIISRSIGKVRASAWDPELLHDLVGCFTPTKAERVSFSFNLVSVVGDSLHYFLQEQSFVFGSDLVTWEVGT
jgi:hypothetical protein